jgi:glycosyltransferase involved in cell wall biosynthesis
MNHKKIIYFIYNSPLDLKNGSNTHILEITSHVAKNMSLLLFAPLTNSCKELPSFISYIKVSGSDVSSIFYQLSYQMGLFIKLFSNYINGKPDVIYERISGWSILPALVAKIFNTPYITEVNGLLVEELKIDHYPSIYIKMCAFNEKRNYNYSHKIVCVTPGIKKGLIDLYNIPSEKIVIINNGANTDLFYPIDSEAARAKLDLEISKKYICFVGNLARWQGVEYLIEAAPPILRRCPNLSFLIIGDGLMKDKLIKLTHKFGVFDNFIFTGSVPYDRVPLYINASNVCVAPFIMERNAKIGLSPLKLYEYMACGKPVVASDISGVSEVLELSRGGISVLPENSEALADAIAVLLENDVLSRELGMNGLQYVMKNHSWSNVAKKLINVCEDAIANN